MDGTPLYRRIGEFLTRHGLWPSPDNYALVYQLVADDASPAALAVRAATNDGLRLTQREADRIKSAHGMAVAAAQPAPGGVDPEILAAATRRIEEFASIVEASRAEAQSYGRDLAAGAEDLERAAGTGSVATLIALTRAMAERTKTVEDQLSTARDEAQVLRVKLAEAGEEARSDPLTCLPNRRAFEEKFAEVQASGADVSLAICDIDHFKRINDSYGHSVGDRVLRLVADLLNASCPGHMVARLGGEEFVILFEDIEAADAIRMLDDARHILSQKHFRVRETDAPIGQITFSAGIACTACQAETSALQRADALLYEAKNAGRNQIRAEDC
jgi:diguanylate cyclase